VAPTTQSASNLSSQNYIQKRLAFRDDITYTVSRRAASTSSRQARTWTLLRYDITRGTTRPRSSFYHADGGFNFRTPYQLVYGPERRSQRHNNQIGAYLQDDGAPV